MQTTVFKIKIKKYVSLASKVNAHASQIAIFMTRCDGAQRKFVLLSEETLSLLSATATKIDTKLKLLVDALFRKETS